MKSIIYIFAMVLPGLAFGADQFRCHAYCVQTKQEQSITSGQVYTLVLAEGRGEFQGSGYKPEDAFTNLAQTCKGGGGTKLLVSYKKAIVRGPNILGIRNPPPPPEFLDPALVDAIPASIAQSCYQVVEKFEDKVIDSTGTILPPANATATQ